MTQAYKLNMKQLEKERITIGANQITRVGVRCEYQHMIQSPFSFGSKGRVPVMANVPEEDMEGSMVFHRNNASRSACSRVTNGPASRRSTNIHRR